MLACRIYPVHRQPWNVRVGNKFCSFNCDTHKWFMKTSLTNKTDKIMKKRFTNQQMTAVKESQALFKHATRGKPKSRCTQITLAWT